ncbi:alpha/beta-hydrolase [Tilletiaria anomala UBC 951]|uniref:Alpha/beta-hydrolase n=1 Tax=Tilletiaria anomala (strain ATCC 24038 / CBS 436.72 / UBC 951) TaxID=1037660 RepID=A0A066W2N3_TILAU|nr:alpha/beta-hydrolase [Tilletiaria anomala UBC 951]KDN47971.1 alpha/beta-hydrolase [Tilletiaria anomala UBC 951]
MQETHQDELLDVAAAHQPHTAIGYILISILQYISYSINTFLRVLISLPWTLWMDPAGAFSLIFFAVAATLVLGFALIFTVIIRLPFVLKIAIWLTGGGPDVSTANLPYPHIFDSLTHDIRDAAYEGMSVREHGGSIREFDLDVAKLQAYVSALVYERRQQPLLTVFSIVKSKLLTQGRRSHLAQENGGPLVDDHLRSLCGPEYDRVSHLMDDADAFICAMAREKLGLEYISLSELSTDTSAVCGMFFDPGLQRNFIILAFKGTTPEAFVEWLVDFRYEYVWAGKKIPGFHYVHSGFFAQLFRREKDGDPYSVIRKAVQHTAQAIQETTGVPHVHLWVTGHSLGAATGTLFYSKLLTDPLPSCKLPDQTLTVIHAPHSFFGAPIVGDPSSLSSFNASVQSTETAQSPRPNVWRVLNDGDAVATLLPSLGDNRKLGAELSTTNQFNFAHFGEQMKLVGLPGLSRFGPGTLLPAETLVRITSRLPERGTGPNVKLPLVSTIGELIPFVGRFASHGLSWYWGRMSKVGTTLPEQVIATR